MTSLHGIISVNTKIRWRRPWNLAVIVLVVWLVYKRKIILLRSHYKFNNNKKCKKHPQ